VYEIVHNKISLKAISNPFDKSLFCHWKALRKALNKSNNGSLQEQKKIATDFDFCFLLSFFFFSLKSCCLVLFFLRCGGFCIQERFVIQAETKIGTKFAKLELSFEVGT